MGNGAFKHNLKHNTKIGLWSRIIITWFGVKMMHTGRKMLKWGCMRCSWCGADPGLSSTVSRKGLRCQCLNRDCTKF